MVTDRLYARVGTLTAGKEWFKPWKTMEDQEPGAANLPELQVTLEDVCEQSNFLNILRDFIVFDDDRSRKLIKKMAGYHQFHAALSLCGKEVHPDHMTSARRLVWQSLRNEKFNGTPLAMHGGEQRKLCNLYLNGGELDEGAD